MSNLSMAPWRQTFRFVIVLLISVVSLLFKASAQSWEPVAVASLGRDRLAVLSGLGELEVVTGGVRKPLWSLPPGLKPIDMAGIGTTGDAFTIVVSSVMRKSYGDVIGSLDVQPSAQQLQRTGTIFSGIALSPRQPSIAYVASSQSREIFLLTMNAKPMTLANIARVPDRTAILGPLAVDAIGQRLYVADLNGGAIWSVPVAGGQAKLFATGLRDIRALAADTVSVFVADGDGHRVVQFPQAPTPPNVAQKVGSARRVPLDSLKTPSAVAIAGASQIAVGDSSLGQVRVIDVATGKVLRRIP